MLAALPPIALLALAAAAIVLAAVGVGLGSGMPPGEIVASFDGGVARTLGGLALIIGLGTILKKLLSESDAAEVIAKEDGPPARPGAARIRDYDRGVRHRHQRPRHPNHRHLYLREKPPHTINLPLPLPLNLSLHLHP